MKNEFKGTLTFLGTGTSQGIPVIACDCAVCTSNDVKDKRLRVAAFLTIGGKNILIDVGPDFRQQLLREGIQYVDAILLTHEHRDHIGGLDDVRALNFRYEMDMPIYAQKRVHENIRKVYDYMFGNYPGVPRLLQLDISEDTIFNVGEVEIMTIGVIHGNLPILGFRINDLVYLTDVFDITEQERKKIRNAKTLVISALHRDFHYSHQTIYQALAMIEDLQPEVAYLIHMSHQLGKHEDVSLELPANVHLAYDGLQIVF